MYVENVWMLGGCGCVVRVWMCCEVYVCIAVAVVGVHFVYGYLH